MTLSFFQAIEDFKHPAALMSISGDIIAMNEGAKPYLAELTRDNDALQFHLKMGQPFKMILGSGMLLTGNPFEDVTTFLLEWHVLTEAETRLALFQEVSKSVNSSLILEEIFDSLGEVLRTFIPFDSGTIVILDESQNSTKVIVYLDAKGQAEIKGDNNIFAGYDPLIDELLRTPQSKLIFFRPHTRVHPGESTVPTSYRCSTHQ